MPWRLSTGMQDALLGTGSLKSILANGQIRVFTDAQPASADDAETGTLLCILTASSLPMTSGVATNGISLGVPDDGVIGKAVNLVISGINLANGRAGYFRWYPNDFENHMGVASGGDKIRLDGTCSNQSTGQMQLWSTTLKAGITLTVDNIALDLKA